MQVDHSATSHVRRRNFGGMIPESSEIGEVGCDNANLGKGAEVLVERGCPFGSMAAEDVR
jgi:hypothetical protein